MDMSAIFVIWIQRIISKISANVWYSVTLNEHGFTVEIGLIKKWFERKNPFDIFNNAREDLKVLESRNRNRGNWIARHSGKVEIGKYPLILHMIETLLKKHQFELKSLQMEFELKPIIFTIIKRFRTCNQITFI